VKSVGGLEQDHHHEAENQQRYGERGGWIELGEHRQTIALDRGTGIAGPVGAQR